MVTRIVKFIQIESRMVAARGWGKRNGKLVFNGHRASAGEDENVLGVVGGDGCRKM